MYCVRGDLLDIVLVVLAAAFAVSGYRQGFIVGVLSFIGFVGGAVLGAEFGPSIAHAIVGGQTQQDIVAVILLVSFAVIGQFIASAIGAAMRSTVTAHSATVLDSIGGSLVSIVSVLLIAWVVGSVLNGSPFPVVDQQVNSSLTLKTLDGNRIEVDPFPFDTNPLRVQLIRCRMKQTTFEDSAAFRAAYFQTTPEAVDFTLCARAH